MAVNGVHSEYKLKIKNELAMAINGGYLIHDIFIGEMRM